MDSRSLACTAGMEDTRAHVRPSSLTHVIYSYDYGASIRETRALSAKFDEVKRQGLFLRSSPSFRKTDWVGDLSTGIPGVAVGGSGAFVTLLHNPDTSTQFFVARQNDATSL